MVDDTNNRISRNWTNRNSSHPEFTPLAPVLDFEGRIPDAIDARLAALAMRAKAGDTAARNALFLALWPRCDPLFNGIRRNDFWRSREGRAWTFDDLEQEAFPIFCDLVERWSGAEPRFAGYFFARLRWRLHDVLRRWNVAPVAEVVDDELLDHRFDEQDQVELRIVIATLFNALIERDREIIERRVIDGETDADLATAFGVSLMTARRRRREAFARAREVLANQGIRAGGWTAGPPIRNPTRPASR